MTTPESIREALLSAPKVRPTGAGTKPALSQNEPGGLTLSLSAYQGITEYDPGEFTFTARAGTRLETITAELANHGQYLPFDPPLVQEGATLGGAIASGLNGPGRYRYGGLRDFILGAVFLTGDGRLIRGGGKVVKNAAGFDFPKLLVGSLGRLGVILEATFKVFPLPQERLRARADGGSLAGGLELVQRLSLQPADLECLDLTPEGVVWLQLAGDTGTLAPRLDRLGRHVGAVFTPAHHDTPDDLDHLRPGAALTVKVPLTPARVTRLDAALTTLNLPRRYEAAAQTAWIGATAADLPALDAQLRQLALGGLSLQHAPARIGQWPSPAAENIVRRAFDPDGRLA